MRKWTVFQNTVTNHPESFAEQSNDNDNNGETDSLTLANALCNVPVVSPVAIVDKELKGDQARKDEVDNAVRPDETATVEEPRNKLRYISKYLVQFIPEAKPKNTKTAVRISGARVSTSDKRVAILKECEGKLKQQDEEKERKKTEREQKRKTREEEQRKKKILAAEKRRWLQKRRL